VAGATCLLHRKPETSAAFWQAWNRLHAAIGRKFYDVYAPVSQALHDIPRSSSLVENLNSRIRNCLTLRSHLNGGLAWSTRPCNAKNASFEPRRDFVFFMLASHATASPACPCPAGRSPA
jgi:hypothetical protein